MLRGLSLSAEGRQESKHRSTLRRYEGSTYLGIMAGSLLSLQNIQIYFCI